MEIAAEGADDVTLVDDAGRPVGRRARATVHDRATPLHLAFSCYLLRHDGQLLLTRRALSKPTWPGVWTNSFCGHPRPGEDVTDAVGRYAAKELGVAVSHLTCVLPDFRYRAVDASGVVENEICPVFVARTKDEPVPDPTEVVELRWVTVEQVRDVVERMPFLVSPWMSLQMPRLREHLHQPSAAEEVAAP
ncbi:MAG TPA: isopentenyl-diphosphate Delta-isomerase [Actinomycetales bacterium]|nr:isopentenyl-diphosphate Delta-isomerase [Actinomycetales bacterium]